jgi:hypothetical protein
MCQKVTVMNLSTNEEKVYMGIDAHEAVIAAYTQAEKVDTSFMSPSGKLAKYFGELTFGKHSVAMGDWAANFPIDEDYEE